MPLKYEKIQNRACYYCGCPEAVKAIHKHHTFKRSTHPHLADVKELQAPLCWKCHQRTEDDYKFYLEIQRLWKIHTKTKPQDN